MCIICIRRTKVNVILGVKDGRQSLREFLGMELCVYRYSDIYVIVSVNRHGGRAHHSG